jgi:hypothetical protein
VPGLGTLLRLVLLYAIHRLDRCPSGQEFASYCRLVKWSKASGGQRWGTSGANIGHAPLTWAFAAAAVLCLRHNPQGQQLLARLEKKPAKGTALTMLAHQLARAVYDMRKRKPACDLDLCLRAEGRGASEPAASRDAPREEPEGRVLTSSWTASWNATVRLGLVSLSLPLCLDARSGS